MENEVMNNEVMGEIGETTIPAEICEKSTGLSVLTTAFIAIGGIAVWEGCKWAARKIRGLMLDRSIEKIRRADVEDVDYQEDNPEEE